MIYSGTVFSLLILGLAQNAEGFHSSRMHGLTRISGASFKQNAVPQWTSEGIVEEEGEGEVPHVPMVTVRFVNTVGGKDVVTVVEQGSNLLFVGDQAGVKLPRSCRTGLCASCTCEVQDPMAIATLSNPRDGFATIRACSTKCFVPGGMDEMVVDVYRMQKRVGPKSRATFDDDGMSNIGSVEKEGKKEIVFDSYVSIRVKIHLWV
jgi:ferredoxin